MSEISRRDALKAVAALGAVATGGCVDTKTAEANPTASSVMGEAGKAEKPILKVERLPGEGPWQTRDPFLFCVHHNDQYPAGNGQAGPKASLVGRHIGSDFGNKDNWNMYHGQQIAGFPRHPHRGFETITVVQEGLIDHADSLGAAARYGDGDVQWLTAGDGINHAEMFPLLKEDGGNPIDFFQIWINLPAARKRVPAYFSMFWSEKIPRLLLADEQGRKTRIKVVAGTLESAQPLAPPPDSWASESENHVAVWTIRMEANAEWTIPAGVAGLNRTLYVVKGSGVQVAGQECANHHLVDLKSHAAVTVRNGSVDAELLILQGRPIAEPVARRGPFVMNTWDEIREAYTDYQRTQFGGWPWGTIEPVHGMDNLRFAKRGKQVEYPS